VNPERATPPRLLLVDDEERILTALRRSLRRDGYEITTAQTPREALERLEKETFDAVLSDYKMPGMTGLELLAKVARLQPQAGKLLITGWAQALSQGELEAIGVDAVIPKPWEDSELKDALKKALR
jgi:CheY-like chemotaxis protein